MTELIQSLKAAVARYPGTMAELARRAAIDRSTLYKILGGQRTPRREQLERLTDALELTEEEKTTLLVQYKQRGRGTDPKMRAALNQLLEAAPGRGLHPARGEHHQRGRAADERFRTVCGGYPRGDGCRSGAGGRAYAIR